MLPGINIQPLIKGIAAIIAFFTILYCLLFINGYSIEPQRILEGKERFQSAKAELKSTTLQEPKEKKGGSYTVGVNVDLVVLHASVYDKKGHFVSGLKKENFKVYEDGILQQMTAFSQEDIPVSMGILLDLSGSMRSKMNQVNRAALAFIKASNPQDQVFLIGFNDEAELLLDFTNDIDEIIDALENIIVAGGTALYDAIYLGVQKAQTGSEGKKAIIVITDGEDKDSYYSLDELLDKVQEADVQTYCVGILSPAPQRSLFGTWSESIPEKARDVLEKVAEETGGKAFLLQNLEDLNLIVSQIASELRNQYSIGYISSNVVRDGSWRQVKIELDMADASNNKVRYRRGYYAPKAAAARGN